MKGRNKSGQRKAMFARMGKIPYGTKITGFALPKNLEVPPKDFPKRIKVFGKIWGGKLYHKGRLVHDVDVTFKDKKGHRWWRGAIPLTQIHNKKRSK
jgi:hypothetical protein